VEVLVNSMLFFFKLMLQFIMSLLPRDKRLWIFGAWHGRKFADNSKYLYLFARKHYPSVRAVWIARNPVVVDEVRRIGGEAYLAHSLKGMLLMLRAGCVITCFGSRDISPRSFFFAGAKHIQLWHGTPLKRLTGNLIFTKHWDPLGVGSLLKRSRKRYHLVISPCQIVSKIFAQVFRVRRTRVVITGYPRNDALLKPKWLPPSQVQILERIRKVVSYKHLILYMPTWREKGDRNISFLFEDFGFEKSTIDSALRTSDAVLLVKTHAFSTHRTSGWRISERVFFASDTEVWDVYSFLPEVSLLITDYSSIYFDFLLLDRPIIFAPFDLNDYVKTRPLYWNYHTMTPGPKAHNWREVAELIPRVLARDEYRAARRKINQLFNSYADGKSCYRVLSAVIKTLGLRGSLR